MTHKTSQNDDYVRAKFRELSDGELRDVVGKNREDYTDEAIELAWVELRARGPQALEAPAELPEPDEAPAPTAPRQLGTQWLGAYIALIGASAVVGPFVPLVRGEPLEDALYSLPGSALSLVVAYGLLKRRLWGWYANCAFIAMVVCLMLAFRGLAGGLGTLVWAGLNGVYFARRRALFANTDPAAPI